MTKFWIAEALALTGMVLWVPVMRRAQAWLDRKEREEARARQRPE